MRATIDSLIDPAALCGPRPARSTLILVQLELPRTMPVDCVRWDASCGHQCRTLKIRSSENTLSEISLWTKLDV